MRKKSAFCCRSPWWLAIVRCTSDGLAPRGVAGSRINGGDDSGGSGRDRPDFRASVATGHVVVSETPKVAVRNQSKKSILAMCDTSTYLTLKQRLKEVTWSQTFAGTLALDDNRLRPGETYAKLSVPIHRRPNEFIEFIDFEVTGVVLAPTWDIGGDGENLLSEAYAPFGFKWRTWISDHVNPNLESVTEGKVTTNYYDAVRHGQVTLKVIAHQSEHQQDPEPDHPNVVRWEIRSLETALARAVCDRPEEARWKAMEHPTTPPPTIATSALRGMDRESWPDCFGLRLIYRITNSLISIRDRIADVLNRVVKSHICADGLCGGIPSCGLGQAKNHEIELCRPIEALQQIYLFMMFVRLAVGHGIPDKNERKEEKTMLPTILEAGLVCSVAVMLTMLTMLTATLTAVTADFIVRRVTAR